MHGGVSDSSAEELLGDIDGVDSVSITYDSIAQSTHTDPVLDIKIGLQQGARVSDPGRFADYVARVGWSIGEKDPTGGMEVMISSDPQVNFGKALESAGWTRVYFDESDKGRFNLGYNNLTRKLGKWPAEPPETPLTTP
jgi:hypothetical protein